MAQRIVVTGGGTGGHLFPGIALARGLRGRIGDCRVLFIGTPRHLDRETLAGEKFELATIHCMGLKGMGFINRLRSFLQLPAALKEAGDILRQFDPQLVFGVGGYVTGPVLLAARMQGIPVCIHEQNSVPGLANRMLSRVANRIFLSMPCLYRFPEKKTMLIGNPVRSEILEVGKRKEARPGKELTLLVLGGSQGAHRVNMLVAEALRILAADYGSTLTVIHQTGKTDAESVRRSYGEFDLRTEVESFFQDMADIYARADIVVSRAGATTLAELAVLGLPALLIPYPYAADNHQLTNARYYEEGGAARTLPEAELTGITLAAEITALIEDPEERRQMAANMKKMGRPAAAERIIDQCLEMMAEVTG